MTAATTQKMTVKAGEAVECSVTHGDDWIVVQSPSGKEVGISAMSVPDGWDFYTDEEKKLFDKLTCKKSPCKVGLTVAEMKLFACASARQMDETKRPKTLDTHQSNGHTTTPPSPIELEEPRPRKPRRVEAREDQSLSSHIVRHETRKTVGKIMDGDDVDTIEKKLQGMQGVIDKVSTETYWLFWYYINSLSKIPNPSHMLWSHGFRFDGSCWIIPESKINSPSIKALTQEWDKHKDKVLDNGNVTIDYCIIRQPEEYKQMFRGRAQAAIDKEIRRLHTSLIKSIDEADQKLAKVLTATEEKPTFTTKEQEQAYFDRDKVIRGAIKTAQERMAQTIECAMLFDATMELDDLIKATREAITLTKSVFEAQVSARYDDK